MKSCFEINYGSIKLAQPYKEGLAQVCDAPIYSTPFSIVKETGSAYNHKTLRVTSNLARGMTVLLESSVAYVPTVSFEMENKHVAAPVEREGFTCSPLSDAELKKSADDKNAFFRQNTFLISPYLADLPDREVLQLVCTLIIQNPYYALEFASCTFYSVCAEVDFSQYMAAMKTLVLYSCPKKNLRPFIGIEDFTRLYRAVKANMIECTTLIGGIKFAVGLYPISCRVNHSCEPNCARIVTPNGCYLVALKDVKEGDELTISYLTDHDSAFVDAGFVRMVIKAQYGFDCKCEPCRGKAILEATSDTTLLIRPTMGDLESSFCPELRHALVTGPKELTVDLNAFFAVCIKCGSVDQRLPTVDQGRLYVDQIVLAAETFCARHGHLFPDNPYLAYVVARQFVKLLRPHESGFPVQIIRHYAFWVQTYETAIVATVGKDSLTYLSAMYYSVLFSLLSANFRLQKATHDALRGDAAQAPSLAEHSTVPVGGIEVGIAQVVMGVTDLRALARRLLGSHFFLWCDLALFRGLDCFLQFIEPNIVHQEILRIHAKHPKLELAFPTLAEIQHATNELCVN